MLNLFRVTKMADELYAIEVNIHDDVEQGYLESLTNDGTPCIYVLNLEDLEVLGIDPKKVQVV